MPSCKACFSSSTIFLSEARRYRSNSLSFSSRSLSMTGSENWSKIVYNKIRNTKYYHYQTHLVLLSIMYSKQGIKYKIASLSSEFVDGLQFLVVLSLRGWTTLSVLLLPIESGNLKSLIELSVNSITTLTLLDPWDIYLWVKNKQMRMFCL